MQLDPNRIAVEYYFGDLQYWKMPGIAADGLEQGFDGPTLRKLAGLTNPVASDISSSDIDSAFREMGVDAPISEADAQLALAHESARSAIDGQWNVFDAATHIRIHLCHLSEPPEALRKIVNLSKNAQSAPRAEWAQIDAALKEAFAEFLAKRGPSTTADPSLRSGMTTPG